MSKIGKWLLLIAGIFAVFAGFNETVKYFV